MRTLDFDPAAPALRLIDQTRLPAETVLVSCHSASEVATVIREMRVRGAPAIGIAAAYGLVLSALTAPETESASFLQRLERDAAELRATRPTAVNLAWALEQMLACAHAATARGGVAEARDALVARADELAAEDVAANERLGAHGLALVPSGANILTHCNAGALATVGYGTALGVVRAAHTAGRGIHVYVDETRPFLQGARLTAWEMLDAGIPMTLITDSMAGHFMARGQVDLVIVGADRITANGDVANKIGTYSLAVLAHAHGLPFYVAAPISTIDLALQSGGEIPIEERSPREVTELNGQPIAPPGVVAAHPAFDITPARLVTAIVTERGIVRAPYLESLREIARGQPVLSR